jgi:hypothetical protein
MRSIELIGYDILHKGHVNHKERVVLTYLNTFLPISSVLIFYESAGLKNETVFSPSLHSSASKTIRYFTNIE